LITLKTLKWSNAFSYGDNNSINFAESPLVQLVGKNGHGKSSIALILEEVLFNKNSKGVKKGDILNRYAGAKSYSIELKFSKDDTEYRIETRRGASQAVKFYRDGTDISSHTSTQTYKQIEEVIGMDHKTFSQIVYQSSASSLEFLTSPDTARKKFLIEILNLGRYTQAGEIFKEAAAAVAKELAVVEGKVSVTRQWLEKYQGLDFSQTPLVLVPHSPDSEALEAAKIQDQIDGIEATNKKISQNNRYKAQQANLVVLAIPAKPAEAESFYQKQAIEAGARYKAAKTLYEKYSKLSGTCPTCFSEIDSCHTDRLVDEQKSLMATAKAEEVSFSAKAAEISAQLKSWQVATKSHEEQERYLQLIDTTLPSELLDEAELSARVAELNNQVLRARKAVKDAEAKNKTINAENAKLALLEGQVGEMQCELASHKTTLDRLSYRLNTFNTLVKTFSTTGLVAYKIEGLVKDLEELANQYLGELSGGRFQISFQISGNDKLNVVITDNGVDIDISALSGGERARVNVATLLAIRKLMQGLSQSRINLLVLDETVEALDVDGKEKLIEVLLQEESLNTVLISHGFSHPLLEKVFVTKQQNISRIEK
jgi:DNA repair exonuclease SbcCD ATPase subunit